MRILAKTAPLALLALFVVLAVTSMARMSVTGDEVTHLPAGYSYVATGDFRMNPQHPPLMKALAGLPLLALDLKPVESIPGWQRRGEWRFGKHFLTDNRAPMRRIVFLGRLPMVAVGVLLGAVLFVWARELWGYGPALFVLFLYCLSPNFLAHVPIVHTDAGVAAFSVMTLDLLWRFSRTGRMRWAFACGTGLGLGLLAKYSGLVTVGVVGILFVAMLVEARWKPGRASHIGSNECLVPRSRPSAFPGVAKILAAGVLVLAVAALLVALTFGLSNYVRGVAIIHADANPHWQAFLWGEYSPHGFWYYYLFAQLWKTPLPTLICFAAALFLMPLREKASWLDWWFVLLPAGAFHAAGMWLRPSIGVRHVLPAFPFLFLACGATAWWVGRQGLRWKVAFAALCVWYAAGTLRVWPDFLPYFNELAGGPAYGVHYLDDSNVEWGQSYYELKDYLDRAAPAQARILAFEPIDRAHYGIDVPPLKLSDAVWPQPGVTYLVGASTLQRNSLFNDVPGVRLHWLERYRPVDRIGWSIYAYRFSLDPADRDRIDVFYVPREQWYEDAVRELRSIIAEAPRFDYAREVMARVLVDRAGWRESRGELAETLTDLLDATFADPGDARARREFVAAVDRAAGKLDGGAPAPFSFRQAAVDCRSGVPGRCLLSLLRHLEQEPLHLAARSNLGSFYGRWGFPGLAAREWRTCLSVDPRYEPARENLARLRSAAPPAESP